MGSGGVGVGAGGVFCLEHAINSRRALASKGIVFIKFTRKIEIKTGRSNLTDTVPGSREMPRPLRGKGHLVSGKCFPVLPWLHPVDLHKLFVEIGKGIIARFIGDGCDGLGGIYELLAGFTDADLVQEFDIGLLGTFPEIIAEGGYTHT